MNHKTFLSLALSLSIATGSFAHSVWIEPVAENESRLVVRFAEPTGNLERSPGHLDSLTPPTAFVINNTNAPTLVAAPKQTNHFELSNLTVTNAVFVETSFTVRAARKPLFYARWQPVNGGAGEPRLTLDLVPTGKPGEARLFLRGQPHGSVKAVLLTPSGDEKEYAVDAEGYVRVPVTEPGFYLLTVAHQREPIHGLHLGVLYKETSHNCSLAWLQP